MEQSYTRKAGPSADPHKGEQQKRDTETPQYGTALPLPKQYHRSSFRRGVNSNQTRKLPGMEQRYPSQSRPIFAIGLRFSY